MGNTADVDHDNLLQLLAARFARHPKRHRDVVWDEVLAALKARPDRLQALQAMETSGGEPDVIGKDGASGEYLFCDCAPESPVGRRSLCYDGAALDARKEAKPAGSALGMAEKMGVSILNEAQYRYLQTVGEFDTKTSSWIEAPPDMRKLGGALFCDRRYGHVFTYHNGVQSYYAGRGFRALLRV